MDPAALRIFQAVVEHRGFARAAEAVFLTQPAVSQAVRRLEAEAGAPLLRRSRPPELTEAGARVLAHARDLALRESLLSRDLDAMRSGGGLLALGASQALAREALPALVAALLARRPRAVLHVETHPSRDLVRRVAEGQLELGLGPFQKAMPDLTRHALGTQRMILHAARGSAAERALRASSGPPFDVPLVTSSLDARDARRGGGLLRERFRAVWEVHSLDLRLELVSAGLAVGYLPEASVTAARLQRRLVAVDWLDFGVIERQAGLFHRAGRELSATAAEMVALAQESGLGAY